MKIISIIEDREVIKGILKHLNFWEEENRAPPETVYEPFDDGYVLN